MLLFPGYQALDVFGPLDVINVLARTHNITLSLIATSLSPVSNKPNMPLNPHSSSEQSIIPTHTLDTAPKLDILLVPGGFGTRSPPHDIGPLVSFIAQRYPQLQAIISICTGAGLLARAGVLDGRKATTNKNAFNDMTVLGRKTHWIAKARWVRDGNVWTAAGVTAGIDATLDWVSDVYGEEEAQMVAAYLEYVRIKDPSEDPFAALRGIVDVPAKE